MKLRVRAAATAVLIAGFALCAPAAPAMAETSVSTPVGEVPVSDVAVAVQTETIGVTADVPVPPEPKDRDWVLYEINILRTSDGSSTVVHNFPADEWTCTAPTVLTANPFTVRCTAIVDKWQCYLMPVTADSLAPNWSVRGTVGCTNSISTGWTSGATPTAYASNTLGNAPVVTCTAEGRSDTLRLPLAEQLVAGTDVSSSLVSRRLFDSVAVVNPVADIEKAPRPSALVHTVKCGPDPYVP